MVSHSHPIPFRIQDEFSAYEKEFTPIGILTAWFRFWKKFPYHMWQFHIESLLIPSYRTEWGKFKHWSYKSSIKPKVSEEEKIFSHELKKKRRHQLAQLEAEKMREHSDGCRRLTFNVSGVRFQTQVRTVQEFPLSLIGNPQKRQRYFDPETDEYYFDRHVICFEAILHFYQTKGTMLNRPDIVPLHIFEEEMKFYQIDPDVLEHLRSEEGIFKDDTLRSIPKNLFERKIWLLFENPESSMQARVVAIISIFVVIVSIFILCLETLSTFELQDDEEFSPQDSFFLTESVAIFWFIFELFGRLFTCNKKKKFLKDFMNIVDFLAIIPFFIELGVELTGASGVTNESDMSRPEEPKRKRSSAVSFLRIIKLVRVLRIFKLSRHSKGLKVLGLTLQASFRELALLLFFLSVGVILFSAGVYYAEGNSGESQFTSIPQGFSWAIGTMTTLGYGDVVPVTTFGKIIGSACAVAGVLTLSLPVPVIVSNFQYYHRQAIDQEDNSEKNIPDHVTGCPYLPECEEIRKSFENYTTNHDDMLIRAQNEALYIPPKSYSVTESDVEIDDDGKGDKDNLDH